MKNIFNGLKGLRRFWQLPAEKQMAVTLDEEQVYFCQLTLPMMPAKEVAEAVWFWNGKRCSFGSAAYFWRVVL